MIEIIKLIADITLDWSPIILSLVAIWISLVVQRQQTRVELFDKRYEVYYKAKEIIKFKDEIVKLKDVPFCIDNGINYDYANCYFALWTGESQQFSEELNAVDNRDIIKQIGIINGRKNAELKELDKIGLLYHLEEKENELLINFYNSYEKFVDDMIAIAYNIDNSINIFDSRDKFYKAAKEFEDNLLISVLRKRIDVTDVVKLVK